MYVASSVHKVPVALLGDNGIGQLVQVLLYEGSDGLGLVNAQVQLIVQVVTGCKKHFKLHFTEAYQ